MKHEIKEGSRNHVIRYYAEIGLVCSESECEVNEKMKIPKIINKRIN